MITIGRASAKAGRIKDCAYTGVSNTVQNSVIQIEIEFQKLKSRHLDKVKLYMSVGCTSWATHD